MLLIQFFVVAIKSGCKVTAFLVKSYHGWFLSVFSLELSDVREDAYPYVLMHKNTRCLKRWERKRQTLGVIKAFTPSKCHTL